MALPIDTIENILNGKGKVRFNGANAYNPYGSGYAASPHHKAYPNHILCSHAIGANELTLFGLPENQTQGATAINIAYMGDWFTFGKVPPAPAYVYSDGFAGCSFYLFRTMRNDIFAIHASRETGKVCDPTEYFGQMGCRLLWTWHSLDVLSVQQKLSGRFSAVLCCIDLHAAYCYALVLKGQIVEGVQEKTVIMDWRRYASRPSPPPPSKG